MSGLIIRTTVEVLVAVFLIWGLFFESKLVAVEDRVFSYFKRRFSKKPVHRCSAGQGCHKSQDCSRYCA
ncbi:MAG: hypothetical protein Q4B04_02605 [bacterium]|nr:hypothetical protein [bacterium]